MRFALLLSFALWACGKSSHEGLPPATDWQTDDVTAGAGAMPSKPRGAPSADPHAGNDPHGQLPEGDDNESGGGGGGEADDPHRGVVGAPPIGAGGQDIPAHATPDRVEPGQRIAGTIALSAKVAGRVKPDGIIYMMAKRPDAEGKPTGSALAVQRLTWKAAGQAFELGGATGEVIVIARYDQDGDAASSQPGDVVGMARVKVPAEGVVVELDTVLP